MHWNKFRIFIVYDKYFSNNESPSIPLPPKKRIFPAADLSESDELFPPVAQLFLFKKKMIEFFPR